MAITDHYDWPRLRALLERARGGDKDALAQIVTEHQSNLKRRAQKMLPTRLCSKVGLSDLCQDIYMKAQHDIKNFRGGPEQVICWLRCLLSHHVANIIHSYQDTSKRAICRERPGWLERETSLDHREHPVSAPPQPDEEAERHEDWERVQSSLQHLASPYRELLRLRFEEGLTAKEIGFRSAMSSRTVERLLRHVLQLVRDMIQLPPAEGHER